jgi:hypothetical protein
MQICNCLRPKPDGNFTLTLPRSLQSAPAPNFHTAELMLQMSPLSPAGREATTSGRGSLSQANFVWGVNGYQ